MEGRGHTRPQNGTQHERKQQHHAAHTYIGSQGGASVIIFGDADGNGGDVSDFDGAGWWRG